MGMLTDLRENWATFLKTDGPSGAGAYFTPALPLLPIPVITEKLGTVEQRINDGLTQTGLSVLIVTVTARGFQNQMPGQMYFEHVILAARVLQNPKVNPINISASDCAEALAVFSLKFKPNGKSPMELLEIRIGKDPTRLCYDVLFKASTGTTTVPVRS